MRLIDADSLLSKYPTHKSLCDKVKAEPTYDDIIDTCVRCRWDNINNWYDYPCCYCARNMFDRYEETTIGE